MFKQTFVSFNGKARKLGLFLTSTVLQVGMVGVAIVVPMAFTDTLPVRLRNILIAPAPPPASPPPTSGPTVRRKTPPRQFDPEGILRAPREIPKHIPKITDEEAPGLGPSGPSVPGGVPCGGLNQPPCGTGPGVPFSFGPPSITPPPPPPVAKPPEKPAAPQRIRVGGNVQQAKLVVQPKPAYPAFARAARVEGKVILSAIIGKDGTIHFLQKISGHPLLVPAALEAVRQWVYQPTLLNGEPKEVATTIEVNFTLAR